jgi:isochorismate synthase EntC
MKRPLADKRPIGPVAQMGSVNELQFNFRFDVGRDATMEDMKNVVMQNAPPTTVIRETLVAPDVKGEVISVTTDNQMVYSDLDTWREKVEQAVSQVSSSSSLKKVVIIGV